MASTKRAASYSCSTFQLYHEFYCVLLILPILIVALGILFTCEESYAEEGKLKWSFELNGPSHTHPAIGEDGTIYVADDGILLYAFLPDGTAKWASPCFGRDHYIAVGDDGVIYVCAQQSNCIHAFNTDGTLKWSHELDSYTMGCCCIAIGADGTIYVADADADLHAISPNGVKLWEHVDPRYEPREIDGVVIGIDGTIIHCTEFQVTALSSDGTVKWRYSIRAPMTPAIGKNGTIYISTYYGEIHALNPDGSLKWRIDLGHDEVDPVVVDSDDTIYVSAGKYVYAINSDGTIKWKFNTEYHCGIPAIGDNNVVYVADMNNLYALNPLGQEKWRFHSNDGGIIQSPAISTEGILYFTSSQSLLALYSSSSGLATSLWPTVGGNPRHTGRVIWFPAISTTAPSAITSTSFTCGGIVHEEGNSSVTTRGVCYNKTGSPTTHNMCTPSGAGKGSFTLNFGSMAPASTYYLRAYAQNTQGVSYGEEYSVTTLAGATTEQNWGMLWRNNTGETLIQYFQKANPSQSALSRSVANQAWQPLGFIDFNGNNSPDVFWRNNNTGEALIDLLQGWEIATVSPQNCYPAFWRPAAFGDFNGDAQADILWRNVNTGEMIIQFLDDSIHDGFQYFLTLGNLAWEPVGAGDFDADGTDDLLFRNSSDGKNAIITMDNALLKDVHLIKQISELSFRVVGIADVDEDGHMDIIWYYPPLGNVYVEYMNALTHVDYALLEQINPVWVPKGAADMH